MGGNCAELAGGNAKAFFLDHRGLLTGRAANPDFERLFVSEKGQLMKSPSEKRNHNGKHPIKEAVPLGSKSKIPERGAARKNPEHPLASELPMVGKLDKSQINLEEILKIAKVMLDKDSPHGENGSVWAGRTLANKIKRLESRYDRSLLENGVETATSIAIRGQIGFLNSAYSIILSHLEKMKPEQDRAGEDLKAVAGKWGKKMKIPDFIDSVIAKYVAPGMGVLGGAAAKLSNLWDGFMDNLKSFLSPQKQWIVDGAKIAAPILAGIADIALVYLARKGLISWAANKKEKMAEKQHAEMRLIEDGRQLMLKAEYGEAEREILGLFSKPSLSG